MKKIEFEHHQALYTMLDNTEAASIDEAADYGGDATDYTEMYMNLWPQLGQIYMHMIRDNVMPVMSDDEVVKAITTEWDNLRKSYSNAVTDFNSLRRRHVSMRQKLEALIKAPHFPQDWKDTVASILTED